MDKLPTDCTSFVYDGFTIDTTKGISGSYEPENSYGD